MALWAVVAAAGCGRSATTEAGTAAAPAELATAVAVVDGTPISAAAVQRQAEAAGVPPRQALADLVDAELLVAEARRRGLGADPEVHAAMAAVLVRKGLAAGFEREVTPEVVSEAEIRAAYGRHADELDRPEIRRVAHLLVPFGVKPTAVEPARRQLLRARADEAAARASGARDLAAFKAIGPALSDGTATLIVEELATGPSGYTVKAFADAAFALAQPGDTSAVVETSFGFHVIRLLAIEPPRHVPLDDVRDRLRQSVWPEVRRREFGRYIDSLVEQHRVELHPGRLDPDLDKGGP